MKSIITLTFITICSFSFAQNNLLDSSSWTVGNGPVGNFNAYGTDSENNRVVGTDPFGNQEVIWIGTPDGTSNTAEGGWQSTNLPIDHSKTYRFTVWMKKNNSFDGSVIFKTLIYDNNSNYESLGLDNAPRSNPIFQAMNVTELNKWYLYVGFVHNSTFTGTTSIGGVYDASSGAMVMTNTDYKFSTSASTVRHVANLWSSGNSSDSLEFFGPTLYEVNGQEPTITELLNPGGNNDGGNSGTTVWNTSGNNINYVAGKVGVGTTTIPNDYLFAVNGKIISEELKVQLHSQWPDYVFAENYSLPSLEEVEKHIQEKGHLINMPSASEVEANGIEVGEMNKLLLEKIEELTLYILKQENKLEEQEKEMNTLKYKVNRLENKPKNQKQ